MNENMSIGVNSSQNDKDSRRLKMWYRYENQVINLDKCFKISLGLNTKCIAFTFSPTQYQTIEYIKYEERDAEFEKICKMLGLEEKEHISRCC